MAPQQTSISIEPMPQPNSQRHIRPNQEYPNGSAQQQSQTNALSVSSAATSSATPAPPAPVPAPVAPAPGNTSAKPAAMKAIWYLGGNHVVKLLTSVDGDLDPLVLSKLEAVPSVVGELALSVESLVSDDFTVGGFESDLLAKIAANTLAAKRASSVPLAPKTEATVHAQNQTNGGENEDQNESKPVPNPLAAHNPVPNPLARITPPGSPSLYNVENTNKRKAPANNNAMRKTKSARSDVPTPLIQAR